MPMARVATLAWVQSTPFGDLGVTLGPAGVEHVALPIADDHVVGTDEVRDPAAATSRRAARVARQLDEFFAGRRTGFDVAVDLDATSLSDFQRHVLVTVRAEVPYGETATYGEVAELAGRPGAARAVGTAMSRNPVPLLVPCHRVVAAGGIGGYGGGSQGVALKRALLDLERRARPSG
jgi:methylated-DNA-[protein]-cysteine S-methyltransferase